MMLIIGVLLLGGLGGGGWFFYQSYMVPPAEATEVVEEEPEVPSGPPAFVRIKPMVLPVVGEMRVRQFITLVVTLEVVNQAAADQVYAIMPRVTDAFLTALYGGIEDGNVMDGNLVNVDGVKHHLLRAGHKVLGEMVVRDVLVQAVHQRRL